MAGSAIDGLDVEGPVQAEVFVLWLDHGEPALTGPCGAEPWYLEVAVDEDPLAVVTSTVDRVFAPVVAPYECTQVTSESFERNLSGGRPVSLG